MHQIFFKTRALFNNNYIINSLSELFQSISKTPTSHTFPLFAIAPLIMDSERHNQLEIFFFPFVGGGHFIPMIDLARLVASHGLKATIISTPSTESSIQRSITKDQIAGRAIIIHTLQLPPAAELNSVDMSASPFTDTTILAEPLRQLLRDHHPDCIIADSFHRWAADVVDSFGVPRIIFNGNCCFARCCEDSLKRHSPHKNVESDSEPFVLPGLPDKIELTNSQLPVFVRTGTEFPGKSMRSEENSYGQVVNSFYELEPNYVDYFRNEMGKKPWLVGPVSLCNTNPEEKAERGQRAAIDGDNCLKWLDSREPNSVVYVSFGSLARLSPKQLHEIACGLEASKQNFIWVVGKILDDSKVEGILPEGFEERVTRAGKGLIIKGWAPQLLILEHDSVGAFMTHCGWNSTLEGVCAGVPMITWPLSAEQFYNEKLITDVLKIGEKVGSEEWASWNVERKLVGREKVEAALGRMMDGGAAAEEMRKRAKELAEKARRAIEEEGSSYNDIEALISELKLRRQNKGG